MTNISLEDVIAGFRKGDGAALKQILWRYRKEIRYFVWSIVKDEQIADEIVNDAFLKTWNARAQFNSLKGVRAYLYTVSRNDSLNFLKSARNRKLDSLDMASHIESSEESIETRMMHSELLNLVYETVDKLPEKQRRVFQMAFFDEFSTEEIAEKLGISTNAVFINKSVALKAIRSAFGNDMMLFYTAFLLLLHSL